MRSMLWVLPLVAACNGNTSTDDTSGDDTGDDTSDTSDTGSPELTVFGNHAPDCPLIGALRPSNGENGFWAAARITPDSYPFELDKVSITLMHQPSDAVAPCVSSQAYTLKMYLVPTTAYNMPPNPNAGVPPEPDQEWSFEADATMETGERPLEGELTTPVTMEDGDHVILVVNTYYTADDLRSCIKTCRDGILIDPPRNYWSNAMSPGQWDWSVLVPASGTGIWAEGKGTPLN